MVSLHIDCIVIINSLQKSETSALRQEIEGLEALEAQMSQSLSAMRARLDRERSSGTLRGRVLHSATSVFGIYCTYRVIVVRGWSRSGPLYEHIPVTYQVCNSHSLV